SSRKSSVQVNCLFLIYTVNYWSIGTSVSVPKRFIHHYILSPILEVLTSGKLNDPAPVSAC
ncbi:hypothetical protein OV760_29830, partial [Salmonella enterica subsp. enterica serovar 1,4,[5],12:i:-]|nr:hypothetical protein [Salmonella enterica subsp. enterica serovar 1,4,[5],12:i:-]